MGAIWFALFEVANSDYLKLVPWGSFSLRALGVSEMGEGESGKKRDLTQTSLFKIPGNFSLVKQFPLADKCKIPDNNST